MKLLALGLAALMSFSAPVGVAHAIKGENAKVAREIERPAICQKADGFFGAYCFDGERAAEWREKFELTDEEKAEKLESFKDAWAEKVADGEIPEFDGEIDLSKCKPGNFAGKRFGGMKDKMPSLPENFTPDKDIEDIKEKLDGLSEEEKAEIKEKVQSSFGEKGFAGKPKIPGNVGRGKLGKLRPSFGTNDQ
ncbi:MAG: hypothetical protein J6J01_06985 [Oscillospiraceae bacterium]|nr:hypothetical protein [Oscillospiraceae bacterium]